MRTVHKYPFEWDFIKEPVVQIFEVPVGSSLLHCGLDPKGNSCLWFEHNVSEKRKSKFQFAVVGTGQEFNLTGFDFVKTIVQKEYVLHIYVKY